MQVTSQDEQDTCRICSAPAEEDAPLFHPCKCSGTIRYIHQDCLTTWLSHSKKKTCDVCKHQYSFTKVYAPDMPNEIPFFLFLRKFAEQLFWGLILLLRGLVVASMWLAFLPYMTVWTWRFYFVMGENIAWWINDRPRPPTPSIFETYYANTTLSDISNTTANASMVTFPVWRTLSSDIFTGQIIASLIVLAFLGVFLLREWIMQNARPGVFRDDEFVEGVNEPQPQPAAPDQDQLMQVQEEVPPPAPDILPPAAVERIEETGQSSGALLVLETEDVSSSARSDVSSDSSDTMEEEDIAEFSPRQVQQNQRKRRLTEERREDPRMRAWAQRREGSGRRAPTPHLKRKQRSLSEPTPSPPSERDGVTSKENFAFTFTMKRTPSPSDNETYENPSTFSFADSNTNEDLHPKPDTLPSLPLPDSSDGAGPSSLPRRPPLPSSSLPTPDNSATGSIDSFIFVSAPPQSTSLPTGDIDMSNQPLPSPGVTTYQAPESLQTEGDAASGSDYFEDMDSGSSTAATTADSVRQEDIEFYFRAGSEDSDTEDDEVERRLNHPGLYDPPIAANLNREEGRLVNVRPLDAPPLFQAQDDVVQDGLEDPDALNDDDVDGALEEAIGMRGPLTSVFQNAALMIFVLDTTIGLGIWLPFTIGKTSALLSLEPVRFLHILHLPIKLIRIATDPVVDFCFFVIGYLTYPFVSLFKNLRHFLGLVPNPTSEISQVDVEPMKETVSINLKAVFDAALGFSKSSTNDTAVNRGIDHFVKSPVGQFLEPHFIKLGARVRINAVSMKATWIELATGDSSINRFFAVVLGYLIVAVLVALYLNVLNVGNVRNAGRAIRNAIRQQLIVLKVAVFIIIELVIFPLGCGIMLDLCTLKLFPNTTLRSRVVFFTHAPVTAVFYHWVVGTMFMYQFAMLLAGCRKIMRPGAMWFIKDPQDPNFHPIRDILDRPTLVQLRKLAVSALLYSVVVALGMGCLIFCLRLWGRTLLPLRRKLREPLSDVPIDLLVLHLVIPPTIHRFRPGKTVELMTAVFWRVLAKELRLTSYMFGKQHPDEKIPSKSFASWVRSLRPDSTRRPTTLDETAFDGSYRRVPALDNIALPREVGATVKVDADGKPLDEAGRQLMEFQNAETEKARRNVNDDYTIVYLPPHFRERVILFILCLWMVATMLFVTALALPIHLGRAAFWAILGREVHDGYCIVVGFYLLWGCHFFGKTLGRLDIRRQRTEGDEPRGNTAVYVFKKTIFWASNLAWAGFWLGFVIPTLIALVVELYVVHPLRLIINPDLTLDIRIIDSWAIGLLYTKLALVVRRRMVPTLSLDLEIKRMQENGLRGLDVVDVTLNVIFPITLGLLACLALPIIFVLPLQHLLPNYINQKALFLYVYPGLFVVAGIVKLYDALQVVAQSWAQQIRDSEFLLERRLRNLDPPDAKVTLSRSQSESTPSSSNISIDQPQEI